MCGFLGCPDLPSQHADTNQRRTQEQDGGTAIGNARLIAGTAGQQRTIQCRAIKESHVLDGKRVRDRRKREDDGIMNERKSTSDGRISCSRIISSGSDTILETINADRSLKI